MKKNTPFCSKCNVFSIDTGKHYTCPKCGDYAVHKNLIPLGTLADERIRYLRIEAHNSIDHIHQN